jgi:type IV pilus assembly protein PilY1
MITKRSVLLILGVLLGLSGLRPALADDTDLLNRSTPAPNVLIIFDTSQSMSWYNSSGRTRGDEYPGWPAPGDRTPMARMGMAKSVLSTVVDTYFSQLRLGLASYAMNGWPGGAHDQVRIWRYWYYCQFQGDWCVDDNPRPAPPRQYFSMNAPSATLTNLQLWVDSTNINMPSQSTFTLRWDLAPIGGDISQNPQQNTFPSGGSPAVTYCRWDVAETTYNHSGAVTGTRNYRENRGTIPCPPVGATGTLTETENFNRRLSGDFPEPYMYNLTRSWAGTAVFNAGCQATCVDATDYPANEGPGWTNYQRIYTYNGLTQFVPAVLGGPTQYSWTYFFRGTCIDGCSGFATSSLTTNRVSSNNPVLPNPNAGPIPFDRVYTWSGNNYQMNPPAAENACAPGPGITVLADVGGAPDANTIKNFLGTGPNRLQELHGANFYTPLAASLETARTYFLDPAGNIQTDVQKDCRENFVILVTDGGESCATVPVAGAGSPGDKAAQLLAASINDLGGARTYVVALDGGELRAEERAILADIAAQGSPDGSGTYYSANSPARLLSALNAIIGSILGEQYSFVNLVVPTLRAEDNLMLIQASFNTPTVPPANPDTPLWQGSLKAFPMDSAGQVTTSELQITAAPLWEAGAVLASATASARTIKTVVGGSLVNFVRPSTAALRAAMNVTLDVNGSGTVTSADADMVIDVVRGTLPSNRGFLGDIFHSVPIVVGPALPTYVDRTFDPASPTQLLTLAAAPDTYAAFRTGAAGTRKRLVLVGANDGMLHAFNGGTYNGGTGLYDRGDGAELWAFIPPQMLPRLQYLAVNQGHRYYVDGSPKVADVWLDANNDGIKAADGSEWRTVLVGGFRQGGEGLYALDITDTQNPAFMWTFLTTGFSWSEPAFAKIKVRIGGRLVDRWVVFVGGGYDPAGNLGRRVHAIDIQTGLAIWQYTTSSPVAASPLVVDMDNDGYSDRVYVGTVGGDLLRLDVSAVGEAAGGTDIDPAGGAMVANWSGVVLFAAGAAQPFYTKPAATFDANGDLWVFIGSGDRSNLVLNNATPNRAYGIRDRYAVLGTTLTEADLSNMTGNNTLDPAAVTGQGWYIIFRAREKEVAETALVFNQQVFFTTFMPGNTTCGDVGSGSVYMVYYLTGGGVSDTALFTASPPQASSRIYQVNAGFTSRPVVTTGTQGANAVVYLGNSNMLTLQPPFSAQSSIRSTRYWRRVLP